MSIGRCVVALLRMGLGFLMWFVAVVVPPMIGVTTDTWNIVSEYVSKMPRPISVRAPGSTPVLFPATGSYGAKCPELKSFSVVGADRKSVPWQRGATRYRFEILTQGEYTVQAIPTVDGAQFRVDFELVNPPSLEPGRRGERSRVPVGLEMAGLGIGLFGFVILLRGFNVRGRAKDSDVDIEGTG